MLSCWTSNLLIDVANPAEPSAPLTTRPPLYDAAGRLIRREIKQRPDNFTGYDANGIHRNKRAPTSETAPGNKITSYRYKELGQTTSTIDPDCKTTGFTYDIRGAKLSLSA